MENQHKLVRVLTALCCEPWLLTPTMHKQLTEIVKSHAFGGISELEQHAIAAGMPAKPAARAYQLQDRTAIIPAEGVIGRKFSDALYSSGVTSVDIFQRLVASAAYDTECDSILMVFDSPGGIAMGIPEAARVIRNAAQQKPVISFCDGLCCSAAYWLASQANAVYASESADVGSIGCYMAVLDQSRAAEMEGIKVEMFKTGKHKGMGYPGTSMNDEQRKMLQNMVDKIGVKFKAAVQSGRERPIADDVMQGQSFSVEDALQVGLIDGIATAEEALRDASTLAKQRGTRR